MRFFRSLLVALSALVAATPASAQLWIWSQNPSLNGGIDPTINWLEGMPPSAVNDSSRAEMAIISKWRDDLTGLAVTTGGPTSYALTTQSGNQGGLASSLVAGYKTCFTLNVANGTPATLAIDGQTAKPLRKAPNTALLGNDMAAGVPYCVTYFTSNGGEYILNDYFQVTILVNTANIVNSAVTYAKLQNIVNNNVVLGNILGANQVVQELNGTQLTALLNVFNSTTNGAVPLSGGGTSNFLRADGAWVAPPGGGPGGTNGQIEWNNAGSLGGFTMSGDATIVTSTGVITIANSAVTYAKMQNISANNRVLGNVSGAAGAVTELTPTQLTTLVNVFTTTLSGAVPGSGGGTANFLRADGTWNSPPGTGPGGTNGQIQFNNSGSFGGFTMGGDATITTGGTLTIGSQAVTYSKIQNESNATLLGNDSGAPHAPTEIQLGFGLTFSNTTTLAANPPAPNVQESSTAGSSTYTTPTSGGNLPLYLYVKICGAGGGGGALATNAGGGGTTTSFGSTSASGGGGGSTSATNGGTGGSGGTTGTGTLIHRVSGGMGGAGGLVINSSGGMGGVTAYGGSGAGGVANSAGQAAATGSCAGGGGAGSNGSVGGAAGGGSGEYVEFIITSPASSYGFTVGTKGSGGAAGGIAGGNGSDGYVQVEAHWF